MAKKHRRFGDRKEGRKLRSLDPMNVVAVYIMKNRVGAQNYIRDSVDVENVEKYIHKKRQEGLKGFGMLHVMLAAYVHTVSQRPGLNRFIGGQKIYARNEISVSLTIKKELKLDAMETVVKAVFAPTDSPEDVYWKLQKIVEANRVEGDASAFDTTARVLRYIPGLLLKFVVFLLNVMDYFDLIPRKLLALSPFHASFFITSMGSLGIPPIYHHLYDFGNVPLFCSYGAKRSQTVLNREGKPETRKFVDFTFVTDERICDGHYFASSLKMLRDFLKNPDKLDEPIVSVREDIR